MKAVILAGGLGTRISEESVLKPKPMVEIGGKPILWHIMKIYQLHAINDFIICCGYKGRIIKDYFANYALYSSDVTIDVQNGIVEVINTKAEPWKITLVDTGEKTMTGGRLKRIASYLRNEPAFCMTYGDGVIDSDIAASIRQHVERSPVATLTAVRPPARFGNLEITGFKASNFSEKTIGRASLINGGFFVLSPEVFSYIEGDETVFENEPMIRLAEEGRLEVYVHQGFWQPMDTVYERNYLEGLISSGTAPWIKWSE